MNLLSVTKMVVSGAVGMGASRIVAKIIKVHAVPETLIDKVTMVGGAWAIGGMVAKASRKYTDEAIDETAVLVAKHINRIKETQKLGRIERKESTFEKEGLNPDDFIKLPSNGILVHAKTYAKASVAQFNAKFNDKTSKSSAAFIMDANILVDRGYLTGTAGEWVLVEEPTDDILTLRKNADGVWEEIPNKK